MTEDSADDINDVVAAGVPQAPAEPHIRPWYRRQIFVLPLAAVLGFAFGAVAIPGVSETAATADDGDNSQTATQLAAIEAERDEAIESLAAAEESAEENATEVERMEGRLEHAQGRAESFEAEAEAFEERLESLEGLEEELADLEEELADLEAELDERAEAVGAAEEVAEQREEAESDDATVGSTIMFHDWEITLAEVSEHSSLRNSSARGRYVVLTLDVTNNASSERDFLGGYRSSFNFADMENDREFTFDSSASLDAYRELGTDAWHLEDIGPGLSGRVPVAIDITEDTTWGMAAMVIDDDVSDLFYIDLEGS